MAVSAKSNLWIKKPNGDTVMVTENDLEPDTVNGEPLLNGEPCVKLKQAFKDLHGLN